MKPVPRLVIVVVPVIWTDSPSAAATLTVEADAMVLEASALVLRMMAA